MENKEPKSKINFLHYVVEIVACLLIAGIAIAALSAGIYDLPIILGGMGFIAGIAAYDIHKKGVNK